MKNLLSFLICLYAVNSFSQEPLPDTSFFLAKEYFGSLQLTLNESNKRLKVYSSKDIDAELSRVVDIRWVFNTPAEAKKYFNTNIERESEGGYEYNNNVSLPNASLIKTYREAPAAAAMYATFGAHHVHWYYIFVIDRVMVKIFTSGKFTQFNNSYSIAVEAANDVSKKLGLTAVKAPEANTKQEFNALFSGKIEKEKIQIQYPPGFVSNAVPSDLNNYFDQQVQFPGEDWVMRYYVVPYSKEGYFEDSLGLEQYQKKKYAKSLSVVLNIMMPKKFVLPDTKEIKDTEKCKKLFNGTYLMNFNFEIGKRSQLGKGYKYCSVFVYTKKGFADCYVIYLSNNKEVFNMFPQVMNHLLRYKD